MVPLTEIAGRGNASGVPSTTIYKWFCPLLKGNAGSVPPAQRFQLMPPSEKAQIDEGLVNSKEGLDNLTQGFGDLK